jgi:hypothetical protein
VNEPGEHFHLRHAGLRNERPTEFDPDALSSAMKADTVPSTCTLVLAQRGDRLGLRPSAEYVSINADYHT